MKIGICINTFDELQHWQLRILKHISEHPEYIVLVVFCSTQPATIKKFNATSQLGDGMINGVSGFFLKAQIFLEERFFFKPKHTEDTSFLASFLKGLPQIPYSIRHGRLFVSPEDRQGLEAQQLDVLLNFSGINLDTSFGTAKHGIWSFAHRDMGIHKVGPIGFWEALQREPGIGCSLVRFTTGQTTPQIIGSAYFNRHWSMTETARIAKEGCVSLLFKHLKIGVQTTVIAQETIGDSERNEYPSFLKVVSYCMLFYWNLLAKIWEKIIAKIGGVRYESWSLFIGYTGFFEEVTKFPKELSMPKDEFWADPFLFRHKNKQYVFFENYSYKTKLGKISCGILEANELVKIVDVLNLPYHLSFPFIFEEDGCIYLMPESSANERLEIYRAIDFPLRWQLFTTAFEGEMVADAFFYEDLEKQKWLFLNKQTSISAPINSELYIYKVDSVKLNRLEPHAQNPVIIDARVARNGGAIFEKEGIFYRPSQRNVNGIYGAALNINKIKKLTIDAYEEEIVQIIRPDFNKKLMALHHLHGKEGLYVFDAAYRKR